MDDLQGMSPISIAEVKEKAKCDALRATEKDVVAAYGEERIERKFREDGNYSWRVKYQQNDNGTVTKDGHRMSELMMPWARADTERHARLNAQVERVAVKDDAGSVHYLPVSQEHAAAANGWHSENRLIGVLARRVNGDFCERCDRRRSWCECR